MPSRLLERLSAVRHFYFVGRSAEVELFRSALLQESLPFQILYLFGTGGIGKTTLLKEFTQVCAQAGISAFYIDARYIEPSPGGFIGALQSALGLEAPASPLEYITNQAGRSVVLLDTYETLAPLDEWLIRDFFPQLPETILFVIAGRQPPSLAWRTDPGWQALMRVLPLRNLDPQNSREFLLKRGLAEHQLGSVLAFTYGHPLALALVADVLAQRGDIDFSLEYTPDVVKTLLERFVQKVPGPAHRAALEACSLVRVTTESLLAAMLKNTEVYELFTWLRGLSFMDSRREGLFPHDLARDALVADLHWRNPEWYIELKHRARTYYAERLKTTTGALQQWIMYDYIFLHRDNAVVRPFFIWQSSGGALADVMRPDDLPELVAMTARHEGERSAMWAEYWLKRQPENVLVIRNINGEPDGFMLILSLSEAGADTSQADPAVSAAWAYLERHAPLRSGERASLFRFWMAGDTYQDVSPVQSLISTQIVLHCLTSPGLAYVFLPCANPDFWAPVFAYADLERLPAADFELDGRRYGVYGYDWRVTPPVAWLGLLADRETALGIPVVQPDPVSPDLIVLSQAEFASSVKEALKVFTQPDRLTASPLIRSRLVVSDVGFQASETKRIEKLQELILQAAQTLRHSPRMTKLYHALDRTYFHPAPSQEIASELLDLPFSTYRRYLKSGIQRVTEILWQREIGAIEK